MSKYVLEKTAPLGVERVVLKVFILWRGGTKHFKLVIEAPRPYKSGEAIGRPYQIFTATKDEIRRLEGLGMEVVEADEGWWPEEDEDSGFVDVRIRLPEGNNHVLVHAGDWYDMAAFREGQFKFLGSTPPALQVTEWAGSGR